MTIENLIILLTLIFPGAFCKILLSKFTNLEQKSSGYIELCEYIAISFGVLFLNLLIILYVDWFKISSFHLTAQLSLNEMKDFNFTLGITVKYFILTIINTCLLTTVFWIFNKFIFPKIKCTTNKENHMYGYSVWETIFHNNKNEFDINNNPFIEIIKDGELLECGLVYTMPTNPNKQKEFYLLYSAELKEILKEDENRKDEDKIFYSYSTYCNIEEKIVIKIYEMEKYNLSQVNNNTQSN